MTDDGAPARTGRAAARARPGGPAPAPYPRHAARRTYAALDLGTNNCRLLIARPADDGFVVVDAFSRIVRLGEGLGASGRLSDAAMDRAVARARGLRRQAAPPPRHARPLGRDRGVPPRRQRRRLRRRASQRETGIALEIITAEQEARLAVLGCHALLEPGDGPALIFDIGGGSTELVLIDPAERVPRILDWFSAPWGVVSLTESEPHDGATRADRARRLRPDARARRRRLRRLRRRARAAAATRPPRLLGTSGTVTTLASLHLDLPQLRSPRGRRADRARRGDARHQHAAVGHVARRARDARLHRPRARRPRRRRLRDPRGDPRHLAGRAARRRRSRHPRGHLALADGARPASDGA